MPKTEETGPVELRDFSLEHYDTTQALAHAHEQAVQRKYEDFPDRRRGLAPLRVGGVQ
jgi:hypothetical protein